MRRRFIVLILILCLSSLLISCSNSNQPSSQPPLSDKAKFLTFYRDLMKEMKSFDALFVPIIDHATNSDIVSAVVAAKDIDEKLTAEWLKIENIKSPALSNKVAGRKLEEAKNILNNVYYYKIKIKDSLLKYAKEPTLDNIANIKKYSTDAQSGFYLATEELIEVAKILGISPDEIKNSLAS